jgi:hypothetical protein
MPFGAQPVDRLDQQPGDEAQQELRHQPVDVDRHQRIEQRGQAEQGIGIDSPAPSSSGRPQRADHHEQRIENVVGGDDARPLFRRAAQSAPAHRAAR